METQKKERKFSSTQNLKLNFENLFFYLNAVVYLERYAIVFNCFLFLKTLYFASYTILPSGP